MPTPLSSAVDGDASSPHASTEPRRRPCRRGRRNLRCVGAAPSATRFSVYLIGGRSGTRERELTFSVSASAQTPLAASRLVAVCGCGHKPYAADRIDGAHGLARIGQGPGVSAVDPSAILCGIKRRAKAQSRARPLGTPLNRCGVCGCPRAGPSPWRTPTRASWLASF